jgi:hypothetical protein
MTPYIQQQLKKLCDNPNWYNDMLISWDKNPRNQREAIYNYLSHVQLNGLLENTQIVFTFIDGDMKPAFYFEIPRDTNRYLILGILDEAGISMYGHYIACKCLDISSKREYMNQYTDIRILTNEIEPC